MLMMKCTRMFLASKGVIHMQTLWSQKVVLNVSLQREFTKVRRSTSCVSKNVTYIAHCLSILKQGVGSTVDWKPRLRNYKYHKKKKVRLLELLITLLMFVVTQMIHQEILDLLLLIN